MRDSDIRKHPARHMHGLRELDGMAGPAAVVIRPDGSLDVYGPVFVVNQTEPPECPVCGHPVEHGSGAAVTCDLCGSFCCQAHHVASDRYARHAGLAPVHCTECGGDLVAGEGDGTLCARCTDVAEARLAAELA